MAFDLLHDYNILLSPFLPHQHCRSIRDFNSLTVFLKLIVDILLMEKNLLRLSGPLSPACLDLSLRNFNLFLADPNAKIYCLEAKPDRLSLLSFIATKTFAHGQHTQTCLTDKLFSYSTLQSLNGRLEWFSLRNSLGSRGWCESVLMP